MSRLYSSKGSSRQKLFSSPRPSQRKSQLDETYEEKPQKKRKGGSKKSVTLPGKLRRKQKTNTTDDDLTTTGDEADGEDDEEEDDEYDDPLDKPAVSTPSHASGSRGAGKSVVNHIDDPPSDQGSDMFNIQRIRNLKDYRNAVRDGAINNQDKGHFEEKLFDLDDDDDETCYQAVEDISDSEHEYGNIPEMTEGEFEEEFNAILETGEAWRFENTIEGMSPLGFGDSPDSTSSEGTALFLASSQSSDEGNDTLERHVHFGGIFTDSESRSAFLTLSESPTMTRALLPSALPNAALSGKDSAAASESEDTDSDLTDDCLPDIALRTPQASQPTRTDSSVSPVSEVAARTSRLKGPPSGTFVDDGHKSAGILDASGKMLIITNPQSLGEQFAKRYGPSAPPSPSMGFAEAVFGDNASQTSQNTGVAVPDPMISSLNTIDNATSNGQAEGPPYAFYAPADSNADYALALAMQTDDLDGSEYSDLDPDEEGIQIEDLIQFDSEDSEDETPTSPICVSSKVHTTPRNSGLSHLNNMNVMSFRRNADPAFAALQSSPLAPAYAQMSTPRPRSRKRKARTDSPYNNAHYKGVTPVQRMTRSHQEAISDSPGPSSKRRRIMT